MTELEQIEAGLAALEAQRGLLGDTVVEMAAAPLRARLATLQTEQASAAAQQLKQVTVMFVDTVGSTAMSRQLDPEDVHAVIDGALQRFTAVVQGQGGRVLQYTGDGLLAAFGADETREDDAERAIRAGLEILHTARELAAGVQARTGVAGFDVRVGLNTGSVLLGGGVDAEGSIRGATVNLAARMEQTAPPGGLRIHHDTYRHVRGLFKVTEQPPLTVKGSDEPLRTYLVQGVKPRALRVLPRGIEGVETRMVAREAELETLQDAFQALCTDGGCRTVTVVAEAGLGKSRLLHEFENWNEAQGRPYALFRGRAEPRTLMQPFGMLQSVLAWRLQIADDDDTETVRRKIVEGIAPLFDDDGLAQAHLLGQLVGVDFSASPHVRGIAGDARQIRNRAFHAAAQVLRRTAQRSGAPLLLLLDDLHWADDGSLDFISYLEQVNRDVPMLLLCMTRPTLFERRPDWALLYGTHQRIELQALDKRGSRELVGVLLQRLDKVPAALRELLIGGAEGNPFYMEELVRMLVDNGAIVTGPERWHLVADKLLGAQVPPTLTGVLQARVDSLPPREKLTLQQASVIGVAFWDQALAAIDPEAPLALHSLVQRGLLVPHENTTLEGQREFAFKNQVLHQVIYDGLLRRDRRGWHACIAGWLGRIEDSRAREARGLAAQHYERAGDPVQACRFYTRAAEDAAARYANSAMLTFVERALALADPADHETRWRAHLVRERHLLDTTERAAHDADLQALADLAEQLDDEERRIVVSLRRAATLRGAGDYAGAEAAGRHGLALARPLERSALAVALCGGLADSLVGAGKYEAAREIAAQGLQLAQARGDRAGESVLVNALGLIAMEQGELTVAAAHFEASLVITREVGDPLAEGLRLNNLGSVYPRLGDYARARSHLERGLQLARRIGHRSTEAALLLNTASVAHLQGDDTAALALANAAFEAAASSGQRDLEAFARLVAGHAELGLGRHAAARSAYTESRDMLGALTLRSQQVFDPISGLARVALAEGRLDLALEQVESMMAHMAAGGSFDGTEEPLLLPLTCWQVLHAAGDPRAADVLAAAHAELQAQAVRITDPQARRGFLQHVPHHREIVAAWLRHAQAPAVAAPAAR